jgi:hypothetical protein
MSDAKIRAFEKIKESHAKFLAREFLRAACLLDDAAEILKSAGEWTRDDTCATIVALRRRMAEFAEEVKL